MSTSNNLLLKKMNLDLKYAHLAMLAGSATKRRTFLNRAKEYRRQWLRLGGTQEQIDDLRKSSKQSA